MTKDKIIEGIYFNRNIIAYCRTISSEWEELKSQLIIQLMKMKEEKLMNAYNKEYMEYMCFVICKRIVYGRIKGTGIFYMRNKTESLDEGYGWDIVDENYENNPYLDMIEIEINKQHWYDKTLFNEYYKEGYNYREISEKYGINIKSIAYTIGKTKKQIKKIIEENGDNNNNND
jgi:hypothetical protein